MSYQVNLGSDLRSAAVIYEKRQSTVKDETGQYPVADTEVCRVWCSVVPQTGSLLHGRAAETDLARTTHKIVIRYRPGITAAMWVAVGGARYDILYVMDPFQRHETLELFCEVLT